MVQVDLALSLVIFFVVTIVLILYYLSSISTGPIWGRIAEYRRKAIAFTDQLLTQGWPKNWNQKNVTPSELGVTNVLYKTTLLVNETSGYSRVNQPVYAHISFDPDCKNTTWNDTIRMYDENFNEVPLRLFNQVFCGSQHLKEADLFFVVNISANQVKRFYLFYSNNTQVPGKNYGNFSGLVAWYPLDEGSGTIAGDYSGYGNNGTLYNGSVICDNGDCPTWVNGKYGTAVSLDGSNDFINVSNSNSLNPDYLTVSLWVKPNEFNSVILSKNYTAYELRTDSNGYVQFYINNTFANSSVPLTVGEWYHITGRYNGSTIDIFIDGEEKGSTNYSLGIPTNTLNLIIANRPGADLYFNGTIDEVRIYNQSLTLNEINSTYYGPLEVKTFPAEEVNTITFDKLNSLRNITYENLRKTLGEGYQFRIEISGE